MYKYVISYVRKCGARVERLKDDAELNQKLLEILHAKEKEKEDTWIDFIADRELSYIYKNPGTRFK